MGVIVSKEQDKTKLQQRITANLRNRVQTSSKSDKTKNVDFAKDSAYVKNLKKTGKFSWIWIVLVVLAILSIITIIAV